MKKRDVFNVHLDAEEQQISREVSKALKQGKLKSVDNLEEMKAFAKEAATNYRKDARVNIRIS